jgi:ankyrin repeat protein
VKTPTSSSVPTIFQAVKSADINAVTSLLAGEPRLATAILYHRDTRGEPLLHFVVPEDNSPISDAHLAVAECLIQHGANVNAAGFPPNNEGGTVLFHACWANYPKLAKFLLDHGADPEVENLEGERVIDNAARHGNADVVELLIDAGSPYTLSHLVQAGLVERTAQLLAERPGLINQRDTEGALPIHHAVSVESRYNPELVRLLIAAGANLEEHDREGRTALHRAIDSEKPQAVECVLKQGVHIDLFAATALGDFDKVSEFLSEDPSRANESQADGLTPLFYAARHGHLKIVQLLLSAGANAGIYVERWWMESTPLHAAAIHGHADICALLLENAAGIESRNEHGYTPLLMAARWGYLDLASLLLDKGANIDAQDNFGVSALNWGAWFGKPELVQILIERGCDVDLQGSQGRTALHFAAEHGRKQIAEQLLLAGADATLKNLAGHTARETAAIFNHMDIAGLFS